MWSLQRFVLDVACGLTHRLKDFKSHVGLDGRRLVWIILVQTIWDQMENAHDGDEEHKEAWREERTLRKWIFRYKCLSALWWHLTTKDCVCWKVEETVAVGEHCTQAHNEGGVNAECVAQVLVQPGPLKDEPEGTDFLFQFFRVKSWILGKIKFFWILFFPTR